MTLHQRHHDQPNAGAACPEGKLAQSDTLPTIWRKRDLALLILLVTLIPNDLRGMQFARGAILFYWVLGLVLFLLPSIGVFRWLLHQAPRHVPLYVWTLRLLPERWRSVVLFLAWWIGVLMILATLGICVSMLQQVFPPWFSTVLVQWLAFAVLLALATVLTCLSLPLFRCLLWIGGGCLLAGIAMPIVAVLAALLGGRSASHLVAHPGFVGLPAPFSWSLFGLTVLNLFGLNGPLLLDGEMQGAQQFLRGSTSYLWWGALGALLIMLLMSTAWILLNPTQQVLLRPGYQLVTPILGPGGMALSWLLYALGVFTCALAYLLIFSRMFLLAARQGYLPRALTRLTPAGTPRRAILAQSAMIACAAVLLFASAPMLLRLFLSADLVDTLLSGDLFGLLTSLAGALWCGLLALLFGFALWLCWKKRHRTQFTRLQRLILSILCLAGGLSALVCTMAPLLPDWPALFFSHNRWFALVLLGFGGSLVLAWESSELPRRSALVREKAQSLAREKALREELQQSLHQQQLLLEEVHRLYQEQAQAARTDAVTSLLNRRALLECLEEVIIRCQREAESFLLVFLDLDHFKAINDTWGHLAGDAVLHEVAERLQQALAPGSVAGRYGGEEFVLLISGATVAQAWEEGESLRKTIESVPCHWREAGKALILIPVTVSIGIAAYSLHGAQSKVLIEQADQAMYQAKLAGRNQVRVASGHVSEHGATPLIGLE